MFSFFKGPAVMMVVLRVVVADMLINVACTFLAIFFVFTLLSFFRMLETMSAAGGTPLGRA